ncbi:MAG: M15 family metallopeptidase [Bacteroidetes bacterium]|nr:M15 family metallopeptidase [Bacteroidota bacterium]
MIYPKDCFAKYGTPTLENNMVLWDVPTELEVGIIPKKLYCNQDMVAPLTVAFKHLIERGFVKELKTFDGCFNIRPQRGATSQSLHSWGIAIDVNASWNQLGQKPNLSTGFVKCFLDAGFDWGGYFSRLDGMHFQLSRLP